MLERPQRVHCFNYNSFEKKTSSGDERFIYPFPSPSLSPSPSPFPLHLFVPLNRSVSSTPFYFCFCVFLCLSCLYRVDQKKVNVVLDQLETCGFLQGVQHVSKNFDFICCFFLNMYINNNMLFLECPKSVLSVRINFDSFSTTLKIYAPKIPMKYSKKCQNFAISNFTIDVLFETC